MKEAYEESDKTGFPVLSCIWGAGAYAALTMTEIGPVYTAPVIHFPAIVIAIVFVNMLVNIAAWGCYTCAGWLDIWAVKTPRGDKGEARFARSLWPFRKDLIPYGPALYFGAFKKHALFFIIKSCAYIIGPSGSGKTSRFVICAILSLLGVSKIIFDFKSELAPVIGPALKDGGEDVHYLNLGDLYTDICPSDEYNPLHIIADLYWTHGGLRDISYVVHEQCKELLPEPKSANSDNQHFRDGSRRLMQFAIQISILIDQYDTTVGDVLQLLGDRDNLLMHAKWVKGTLEQAGSDEPACMPIEDAEWTHKHPVEDVQDYVSYFRNTATELIKLLEKTSDTRTFDNYMSDAIEALSGFNISTRAHQKTKRSTFRFSKLKEGKKASTVFIMLDANTIEATKPVLGLIRWGMLHELKRHTNKSRLVFIFFDEAGSIPWGGDLEAFMTWCRAYGLRCIFIFQNYAVFEYGHGKKALEVLKSESEIKLYLPHQRHPDTVKSLEHSLGNSSYISKNHNGNESKFGIDGFSYQEQGKPVMDQDKIKRNSEKGILMVREHRPLLVDLPSIAEIHPYRKKVSPNPMYGNKPYLKRIKLRIRSRKPPLLIRAVLWPFRLFTGGKS